MASRKMEIHEYREHAIKNKNGETMNQSVEQEISSLFGKTAQELRKVWKKYFPSEAPPYYKKYLIDKIAYRMQEIEYGKLSKEEERKLNSLADRAEQGKKVSGDELLAGTKLIKEYNGKYHDILVTWGLYMKGNYLHHCQQ